MTPEEEKILCSTTLHKYNEVAAVMKNNQDEFFSWCNENKVYEIWTAEYIDCLCLYLNKRLFDLDSCRSGIEILECGAGNGLLTHHINEWFGANVCVAIDDDSWDIKKLAPVVKIGIEEAVSIYKPFIVIHSWMPYTIDFTDIYRECNTVQEYILIGEAQGGCCGHEIKTWDKSEYENDGFYLEELDFNEHQLCRTDHPAMSKHSYTISFKRSLIKGTSYEESIIGL